MELTTLERNNFSYFFLFDFWFLDFYTFFVFLSA